MSKAKLNFLFWLERVTFVSLAVFLCSLTFSTALMEISSVVALVGWVLLKAKGRMSFHLEKRSFFFLLAFVSLSSFSFFWSEFPKQSFRGIFKVLQQFFIFWVAAEALNTSFRLERILRTLTWLFLFLGLDGVWQYASGKDLIRGIPFEPASAGPRISASFHNYGLLASFLITFGCVLIGGFDRKRGAKFLMPNALGTLLGLLLLFWTRLRGAWLAFLGGVGFYLWMNRKRVSLLVAILALAAGFFFLPRSMMIHLDAEGKEQSLVERFYLWDRALQVIQARPLTGTGINTYSVAHQKYDRRENWRVRNYYAHNGYLQMAAETGLPSLACFLGFIFFYFRQALGTLRRLSDESEKRILLGILTGMANFLILGLIDTTLHNPPAILGFWFLAGWGAAYQRIILNRGVSAQPD